MSKTDPREIPIIIPSYEPDEKLIKLLADLKEKGFSKIVIVDDGSGEEYQHFFEQADRVYRIARRSCRRHHNNRQSGEDACFLNFITNQHRLRPLL